uniref:Solute carrier family 25 member 44 n=1 Tax=Aegilops tauschii subsp. strangulata TaxID=200361 RepID=A0A453KXR9_AEGTS
EAIDRRQAPPPPPDAAAEQAGGSQELQLPADIDWERLDKSRFFVLGAGLFSAVSTALYPAVVLKTRLQLPPSAAAAATTILRREGPLAFYRGFATSLAGTVPARALYMGALEATRSVVGPAALGLGAPEPAASAAAGAAAGLTAAVAAQVVWTPVDVISQRLMVQGNPCPASRYHGGLDAFRKIVASDGLCGLYRGFGMSILTYAPSNAVWWATYSLSQKIIWSGIGCYLSKLQDTHGGAGNECRDSRWRRGACDHAAGHHQDQDAGHGRPRRANHHWADGAGADQGRRVGRVLQGPRPEVGVHVLVCHHHDHHV